MIANGPKVSVVIPAYNAEETIFRALHSLQNQTFREWEAIVVDDCSTDGTTDAVKRLAHHDSRITLICQPEHKGTFRARWVGIKRCRGDYVSFVDADDQINTCAYAQLTNKATTSDVDIVIFGAYRVSSAGILHTKVSFSSEGLYASDLLEKYARLEFGTGALWNKFYRRSLFLEPRFERVSKALVHNEDYLVNISCFGRAQTVLTLPDIWYYYMETENSQTSQNVAARSFVVLYEAFADALELFNGSGERVMNAIVTLYKSQLAMDYCRVRHLEQLAEYRSRLEIAVCKIATIKPDFIFEFFHNPRTPPSGFTSALLGFAAKVKRTLWSKVLIGANTRPRDVANRGGTGGRPV